MNREIYANSTPWETRVAILEDGRVVEVFIERESAPSRVGNIYRGRVTNVLPGMQSAFVNIGLGRDAFLYITEVYPTIPSDPFPDGTSMAPRPKMSLDNLLRVEQELLVQITKESLGHKAPRVTTQVSLPGRKLVFIPGSAHRAVSHRIPSEEERERLQEIVEAISGEGGFIVRTAAAGTNAGELGQEADWLREEWRQVMHRRQVSDLPSCVHQVPPSILRVLRDYFGPDIARVVVDREETYLLCREYASLRLPDLIPRLEKYSAAEPIFERYGIQKELDRALRPRVWLPSGGYLVIHPTEALVAIDVNTGKYVGTGRFEETALKINLEAAREVVRQIRLRDLGGILVVDFIDLEEQESRDRLTQELEQQLDLDRARSRILKISEFGLVEITRQRTRPSLEAIMSRSCPTCKGSGRIPTVETIHLEIEREIRRLLPLLEGGGIQIRVHPTVKEGLRDFLALGLEPEAIGRIRVEPVDTFIPQEYEVLSSLETDASSGR